MKFLVKLVRINYTLFILIFFLINLLISSSGYIFNINAEATENSAANELLKYPVIVYFMVTVIFIPFVETVFYQALIIEIIKLKAKKTLRLCLSLTIPAILFGISHSFSTFYIIATTISGFFYALAYYISSYRKEPAILTVSIIHSLGNLAAFIDNICI